MAQTSARRPEGLCGNWLAWPFRKQWIYGRSVADVALNGAATKRLSIWAVVVAAVAAASWSSVASLGLLGWDPHYYYSLMVEGTWAEVYPFEQTMFRLVGVFRPSSFASYEFIVVVMSLSVLLLALYRLEYSRLDQLILLFFFSFSFYGLHFLLTFHRQFFGLVFFLLAISGGKRFFLARILSLFSQLFTFTLHVFWELRRLSARAAAALVLAMIPVAVAFANWLPNDKAATYGDYGASNSTHLILRQALTLVFCILVLATVERGKNPLRSLTAAYIAFSLPVLVWPFYAGVFVRVDYFFFPLIVALWPRHVRPERRRLCRLSIVALTVVGLVLWMRLNTQCLIMGDCEI